jgi:phosphoribosyl-ATP pyrophosphohydrolase/phosphoribosyl-AMP cyclohydrolase
VPTTINLNTQGLVPAIAQDARTGKVLMVANMSEESLKKTLETGQAWFYSRSRRELWHKGATSGNYLNVVEVRPDCDGDVVLLRVEPTGPACHTGNETCFFQEFDRAEWRTEQEGSAPAAIGPVLEGLAATIAQRHNEMPDGSYTTSLFQRGTERIAQKLIEEGGETALAAMAKSKERTRSEAADLLYHLLVLLEDADLTLEEVAQELADRRR